MRVHQICIEVPAEVDIEDLFMEIASLAYGWEDAGRGDVLVYSHVVGQDDL